MSLRERASEELGGSASVAAIASFVPFTLGAAVPVLPFVFLSGTAATVSSVAASACASRSPEGQQFPAVAVRCGADERRPIRT